VKSSYVHRFEEMEMVRTNLASMSIDELLKLRDAGNPEQAQG
jgi:hypothetical protein